MSTAMKSIDNLVVVANRNIIGSIKHELYTITVTDTNVVFTTNQYTYIANSTSNMYIHFLGLIELHKKEDKTEEEKEIYENILDIYTCNINWHTLWFNDVELAGKVYGLHVDYLNKRMDEAINAKLTEDDGSALQELIALDKAASEEEDGLV